MDEQNPIPEPGSAPSVPLEPRQVKTSNAFVGDHGIRAGWRLLIYVGIVVVASVLVSLAIAAILHPRRGVPPSVWAQLTQEVVGFAIAFGAAMIMSRIEHRPVGAYGLPRRELFGGKFWLGFLFGLLEISILIWLIRAFGGYSFGQLALHGRDILSWGLFHLVLFTFVGLFEEFLFRGYMQYTLADGIGFWPAALILSFLFGGVHLGNPGEGWVGAASVVMIALLFCFSLKRTGNLWYAVGLHASFDWGETFLYSVPNSGIVMKGHLSDAILQAGPKWLTGGTIGPEGSVFCFLTILLQFLVVMWLFPAKKEEGVTSTAPVTG
jgi:membrane protease YdiL (CAAX protease family)